MTANQNPIIIKATLSGGQQLPPAGETIVIQAPTGGGICATSLGQVSSPAEMFQAMKTMERITAARQGNVCAQIGENDVQIDTSN